MEQKLVELKGELGKSAIIVGDFNIFLSTREQQTENQQGYKRTRYHPPV